MSELLQHQIAYYRARAPEYDEWFYRQGLYDRGQAERKKWELEAEQVRRQLLDGPRPVHVLELAPGTGIWTSELIKIADEVTALDASPEMIAINRAKTGSDKVSYHLVDLFAWQPARQYDMVFFGFWISHVPEELLSAFLAKVHMALKPGGRLFLVDSQQAERATAAEHDIETQKDLQKRVLNDGSQFEIVKIYYEPEELTASLRAHGFDIEVRKTATYFIYADGIKPGPSQGSSSAS